jgi:hypothetical protein
MLGFEYVRASDVGETVATVSADPAAAYLAGGTTQLDLMLKDGVVDPTAAGRHHPSAAARDHPTRRHAPGRGADNDGGAGR